MIWRALSQGSFSQVLRCVFLFFSHFFLGGEGVLRFCGIYDFSVLSLGCCCEFVRLFLVKGFLFLLGFLFCVFLFGVDIPARQKRGP